MSAPGLLPLRIGSRTRCLTAFPLNSARLYHAHQLPEKVAKIRQGAGNIHRLRGRGRFDRGDDFCTEAELPFSRIEDAAQPDSVSGGEPSTGNVDGARAKTESVAAIFERLTKKANVAVGAPVKPIVSASSSITATTTPVETAYRPEPIRLLQQAIAEEDDKDIWKCYSTIISDRAVASYLRRSDFEAVIMSIKPEKIMSREWRCVESPTGQTVVYSRPYAYNMKLRPRFHKVHNYMMKYHPEYKYTLPEYNRWLELARAGNDYRLGSKIFITMLQDPNVTPNVQSYNIYMSIVCGDVSQNRWSKTVDHRVTRRLRWSEGYGAKGAKPNVRSRARALLERLLEAKLSPDSMTIDMLISTFSKVGDFDAIAAFVQEVWGLDVAAIEHGEARLHTDLKRDAANYPTAHTLQAIAKAYGAAGKVELADKIVRHMATVYKVPISMTTWRYLLNWAYTWSNTVTEERTVEKRFVQKLWDDMTSAPYNVEPTFEMYDYIIRHTAERPAAKNETYKNIEAAIGILEKTNQRYDILLATATELEAALYKTSQQDRVQRRADEELRALEVTLKIMQTKVKRWIELFVYGRNTRQGGDSFSRRYVPNVLLRWGYLVNQRIMYVTKTGFVELKMHDQGWRPLKLRRTARMAKKRPKTWLPQSGKVWGDGSKEDGDF